MKVLTLVVVAVVAGVADCALEVLTEGGRIQGKAETSINRRKFHSFYSIPYARPPLGAYRFKDPVPPVTWVRLADATVMPPPCLNVPFSNVMFGKRVKPEELTGSENCLYLNVFTPVVDSQPQLIKLPVMVWIHGGGFFSGGAYEYLPHALLDHDIVLVVVQYRLDVLGFLSTEDSVMPGNLGLKDQTMALQWVQRNIHLFGGDKSKVTIFGESAGGASVHFHMLSPKSEGLFSRVIMQSGSALSRWAQSDKHREVAHQIGRDFGCEDVQNSTVLLSCLQKVDARELVYTIQDSFKWCLVPMLHVPRVDGEFLPEKAEKMVREGRYHKVDLMAGVTSDEGAIVSLSVFHRPELRKQLVDDFPLYGPLSVYLQDEEDPVTMAKQLYDYYSGGVHIDESHADQITQLYGDLMFSLTHDEVTRYHTRHADGHRTYRYEFEYRGKASLCTFFDLDVSSKWVSHADDLFYLFVGGPLLQPTKDSKGLTEPEDIAMREKVLKLWTNFATTGNPTPDKSLGFTWEPSTEDDLHYLALNTSPSMKPDNRKEVREFIASVPMSFSKSFFPGHQKQHTGKAERHPQEEL